MARELVTLCWHKCGEELWQFWNVWNQFVCTPAVTGRDGEIEKRWINWITCWSLTDSIQQLPLLSAWLYHRHRCEGLAERGIAMNHVFCFTWHHFTALNEMSRYVKICQDMSRNVNVGFWTILTQRIPESSAVYHIWLSICLWLYMKNHRSSEDVFCGSVRPNESLWTREKSWRLVEGIRSWSSISSSRRKCRQRIGNLGDN